MNHTELDSRSTVPTSKKRRATAIAITLAMMVFAALGCPRAHADNSHYTWSETGHLSRAINTDWSEVDSSIIQTRSYASDWHVSHANRFAVIDNAVTELWGGLCGDAARQRYDAEPGKEWCSEFARSIYLFAGATRDLEDDTKVADLVDRFSDRGGWSNRDHVNVDTTQPGDYVALTTLGIKKNHSAIIVAISDDLRYIWTIEGNNGDCVAFVQRDFLVEGALNPDIDGIGNADVLW